MTVAMSNREMDPYLIFHSPDFSNNSIIAEFINLARAYQAIGKSIVIGAVLPSDFLGSSKNIFIVHMSRIFESTPLSHQCSTQAAVGKTVLTIRHS